MKLPATRSALVDSVVVTISSARLVPHLLAYRAASHEVRQLVDEDLARWSEIMGLTGGSRRRAAHLLTLFPEFRNLFYFRLGRVSTWVLRPFAKPMESLYIYTPRDQVGGGLFLQHGFSTVIAAARVGRNCWVNQQVTIGFDTQNRCPVLEDGVVVASGAKVIGGVTVGHDSVVGANAVVVKDVPPHSTAVGVPARVLARRR